MTSELKPCPFCGGKASIWNAPWAKYKGAYMVQVVCGKTHCVTMGLFKDADEAVTTWNQRAERTCKNVSVTKRLFDCSACSHYFPDLQDFKYCPECGAKVVGD